MLLGDARQILPQLTREFPSLDSTGVSQFESRVPVPGMALRPRSNLEFTIACDSVPQSAHYVREANDSP